MSDKTPGQRAYEAWSFAMGAGNGSWEDKSPGNRDAWERAAAAVMPQRNDGMTDDERDVWKAAYGFAMAAAIQSQLDEDYTLAMARDEAFAVADEAVASLSGLGGLPIEVTKS